MAQKYAKPALTYADQAALLVQRGMLVKDHPTFLRQLEAVGYYRLCAYWHPFKRADNTFAPGTSFAVVWERYVFDRHLRLCVMDALERVEVSVRTALVTELAMVSGPFAHINIANFPGVDPAVHGKFLDGLRDDAQNSKEEFVGHFQKNYVEFPDLPIWAAAETMTFGSMLTLFNMSPARIQGAVSRRYGIFGRVLQSWLRTLHYLRNLCAHHSRLWNRELAIKPQIPDFKNAPAWHKPMTVANNRIWVVLLILRYMLRRVAPQSHWHERISALFAKYSPVLHLPSMGMQPYWQEHQLWKELPAAAAPPPEPKQPSLLAPPYAPDKQPSANEPK